MEHKSRTLQQNKFYFAVISDIHKKAVALHLSVTNSEYLRSGLKELDENYPKYEGKPVSSRDLTTKELVDHIEFIILFMGNFNIVPKFVDDEWERLKAQAHNYKG